MRATRITVRYDDISSRISSGTTYASVLGQEGKRLLGRQWGGVWARDTVPRVTRETRARIVNIDSSTGPGIHWVAALDIGGQRYMYYNDPLGHHGETGRIPNR